MRRKNRRRARKGEAEGRVRKIKSDWRVLEKK